MDDYDGALSDDDVLSEASTTAERWWEDWKKDEQMEELFVDLDMRIRQDLPVAAAGTSGSIFLAARTGDIETLRNLIELVGVDPNSHDAFDATPLYLAAYCGHHEAVRYLLSVGARADPDTFDGERAVYGALTDDIARTLRNASAVARRRGPLYSDMYRLLRAAAAADLTVDSTPPPLQGATTSVATPQTTATSGAGTPASVAAAGAAAGLASSTSTPSADPLSPDCRLMIGPVGSPSRRVVMRAHRAIISAGSPVLRSALPHEEGVFASVVELPAALDSVPDDVTRRVVAFLYTDRVTVPRTALKDAAQVAAALGLELLEERLQAHAEAEARSHLRNTKQEHHPLRVSAGAAAARLNRMMMGKAPLDRGSDAANNPYASTAALLGPAIADDDVWAAAAASVGSQRVLADTAASVAAAAAGGPRTGARSGRAVASCPRSDKSSRARALARDGHETVAGSALVTVDIAPAAYVLGSRADSDQVANTDPSREVVPLAPGRVQRSATGVPLFKADALAKPMTLKPMRLRLDAAARLMYHGDAVDDSATEPVGIEARTHLVTGPWRTSITPATNMPVADLATPTPLGRMPLRQRMACMCATLVDPKLWRRRAPSSTLSPSLSSSVSLQRVSSTDSEAPHYISSGPAVPGDVLLTTEDGAEFPAHRSILMARSLHIRKMLSSDFAEGRVSRVNLPGLSAATVAVMLVFMYTDELPRLDRRYLAELLYASDLFMLEDLRAVAVQEACQRLDWSNVMELLRAAEVLNLLKLTAACSRFLAVHLDEATCRDDFADLVLESAFTIESRQVYDSVPVLDTIRTEIEFLFGRRVAPSNAELRSLLASSSLRGHGKLRMERAAAEFAPPSLDDLLRRDDGSDPARASAAAAAATSEDETSFANECATFGRSSSLRLAEAARREALVAEYMGWLGIEAPWLRE